MNARPLRVASSLAIVGSVAAVALHIRFGLHAGALWRDEVGSLNLATVGSLSEMWSHLNSDSIPALFLLVLRLFAGVPAGASDIALRGFGVAIGLSILAALWWNARWLGMGAPLLSLALVEFNPMMIRYGDSIRAYGLGILLILLAVGAIWKLSESATPLRVLIATLCAVLSVQCLYYNAVLLFAVCMGGVAVTLRARKYRDALLVLVVGGIAALSLLPYWDTLERGQSTNFMWKVKITNAELWENFGQTVGATLPGAVWLWVALFAAAGCAGTWLLAQKTSADVSPKQKDRVLFALVTLLVGAVSYAVFLNVLSYRTRPWYYLAFIAFAATCLEMIFASVSARKRFLFGRAGLALVLIAATAYPAWEALRYRQTNVDMVAAYLEGHAQKDDLVVINAWNYGISFQRYYEGPARFATIPPIADLRFHRVDLAKEQMMSPDPIAPVLGEISQTLRGGRTVWLVGRIEFVPEGRGPLSVAPGFDGPRGWEGGDLYQSWSEQLGFLFQSHAENFQPVAVPLTQPVMRYENLRLSAIRDWRE